ncbi:MAG: hypothetical protein ACRDNA_14540, partial [Gaiellaceae bacterium]
LRGAIRAIAAYQGVSVVVGVSSVVVVGVVSVVVGVLSVVVVGVVSVVVGVLSVVVMGVVVVVVGVLPQTGSPGTGASSGPPAKNTVGAHRPSEPPRVR